MKVALCVIAKCENLYIREFVEYYKQLGIDNIILYDNNDINGENFNDVISHDINNGFVILKNKRGLVTTTKNEKLQLKVYNECYAEYSKSYDWIAFFDVDEYLILPNRFRNIKEWLSCGLFDNFGVIQVNWKCYGDNELLYYENKPLNERFTTPCMNKNPEDFIDNCLRKSIVRTNIPYLIWIETPHVPLTSIISCISNGKLIKDSMTLLIKPEYEDCAFIKHFITKTIEEYVRVKMQRGYPDQSTENAKKVLELKDFFNKNIYTKEKEELANKILEKIRNNEE